MSPQNKLKKEPCLPSSSMKVNLRMIIVDWELGDGVQVRGGSSDKNEMGSSDMEETGRYFSGILKK